MLGEEYIRKLDIVQECLEFHSMPLYYYNPAMILARINTKPGAYLKDHWTHFEISTPGDPLVIVPLIKDKRVFYSIYLWYLKQKKQIKHIAKSYEQHLSKICKIKPSRHEYICKTETLINFPWGKLQTERKAMNKIKKNWFGIHKYRELCEQNKSDFLECNTLRYSSQTKLWSKFRLNGKKMHEWLLDNIPKVNEIAWRELIKCKWLFLDWKCASFAIGTEITKKYRCCYTRRRYDSTTPGLWYIIRQHMATFYKDFEFENDGSAWNKHLVKSKVDLAYKTMMTYATSLQ